MEFDDRKFFNRSTGNITGDHFCFFRERYFVFYRHIHITILIFIQNRGRSIRLFSHDFFFCFVLFFFLFPPRLLSLLFFLYCLKRFTLRIRWRANKIIIFFACSFLMWNTYSSLTDFFFFYICTVFSLH